MLVLFGRRPPRDWELFSAVTVLLLEAQLKGCLIVLWTIVAILVVLWLLGLVANIGGGLIHLLLLVAGVVFVFQLISGRRSL